MFVIRFVYVSLWFSLVLVRFCNTGGLGLEDVVSFSWGALGAWGACAGCVSCVSRHILTRIFGADAHVQLHSRT